MSIYILFLFVIKKKEPLPLRGSKPSTYTVDSPRDAPSLSGERGVQKGVFWGPLGGRILARLCMANIQFPADLSYP